MLSSINKKLSHQERLFALDVEEDVGYIPKGIPREQIEGLGIYEWKPDVAYQGNHPTRDKPSYALRNGRLYRSLTTNIGVAPESSFEWVRVLDSQEFYHYGSSAAVADSVISEDENIIVKVIRGDDNTGFTVDIMSNDTKIFNTITFSDCMFYITPESTDRPGNNRYKIPFTLDIEIYFNGIKVRNIYIQESEVQYYSYTLNNNYIEDSIPTYISYNLYILDILDKFFGAKRTLAETDTIEVKIKAFAIPPTVTTEVQ